MDAMAEKRVLIIKKQELLRKEKAKLNLMEAAPESMGTKMNQGPG